MTRTRYAVVLERANGRNWSAYVPDVDGCISTGTRRRDAHRLIAEALQFHLEWMARDGDPIPAPGRRPVRTNRKSLRAYVEVELPAPAVAAG